MRISDWSSDVCSSDLFITKPMFFLIDFFYRMGGNFGVAILLSTVLIKLAFFPLANKSYVSMSRMKLVQPQMLEIRERFKDDKVKQIGRASGRDRVWKYV